MAAISPQELLKAWKLETVTSDMALGHIVQNLVILREDIDRLIAHTNLPPRTTGKAKLGKLDEPSDPKQPS